MSVAPLSPENPEKIVVPTGVSWKEYKRQTVNSHLINSTPECSSTKNTIINHTKVKSRQQPTNTDSKCFKRTLGKLMQEFLRVWKFPTLVLALHKETEAPDSVWTSL